MTATLALLLLSGCGPSAALFPSNTDAPDMPDTPDTPAETDDTSCVPVAFFTDADADGYGDGGTEQSACAVPAGAVTDATDCDDTRAAVFPGASETCNELDDDCDGTVDDDPVDGQPVYVDADGDGYGVPGATIGACTVLPGYSLDAADCDDGDAAVNPGATEVDCADPIDYNCDGSAASEDLDGDGWAACEECDDTRATSNPAGVEVCDGSGDGERLDEDCDSLVDDADPDTTGGTLWYRDADGDGAGTFALVTTACFEPSGFSAIGGDCDDLDAWRCPTLPEVCDGENLDEDCSSLADDADVGTLASTFSTFARDADGDGYGNAARSVTRCDPPAGYVSDASDCDDADAAISPAEPEACDEVDNDCDALVDDADSVVDGGIVYYADADADGAGDPEVSMQACSLPVLFVENADDCDDADATTPSAERPCPGTEVPVASDSGVTLDSGVPVDSSVFADSAVPTDTADTGADTGGTTAGTTAVVRFVAMGDTGDGSLGQYDVAAGIEAVCASVGCDFVLLLGDNFYPGGVTSTTDLLWTDNFELPYANIDLQFRAVMGNHDWDHTLDTTMLSAQVDYTAVSSKWYMPADYYTFVEGDTTFFGIDSHVIDFGAGAAQERWLPSERASSTTTWNIAYGHHPYISNGPHGNATGDLQTFYDSFVCGEFDVYLTGHDHNLQWLEETCGTTFLVSGAGHSTYPLMGANPVHFEASSLGFLWVEIDGADFTGVFYNAAGVELYRRTMTK